MSENSNLYELLAERISYGEKLIASTQVYGSLEGLQKLQRKIKQELKFLTKISKARTVKKEHLQCSNLTHFSAVLDTLKSVEKCVSVNKVFMLDYRKIIVDIICDDGLTWVKVVARNPKSLSQISMGDASYGVRSVIDQAEEFVECAKQYPCLFQTPKVVFVFSNGITENVALKLEELGVTIRGERLPDEFIEGNEEYPEEYEAALPKPKVDKVDLSTQYIGGLKRVNLDVSAMLAYTSSVTNGSAHLYDFPVKVLAQQAEWERERPQKPILDNFFKDKRLFCCQTAKDNFVSILQTVGGPNEKIRGEELLKRLTVLPDNASSSDIDDIDEDDGSEVFKNVQFTADKYLPVGGQVKERSLVIFTFGDRIKAVTVTANDGFVRAAKQQGINFVVFVHESRALTEQKEQTKAVPKN